MKVQQINNTNISNKRKYNLVKITGYSSLGFAVASVAAIKNHSVKTHKILAGMSIISAIGHIGIIEYFHHKYKKSVQS